MVARPGAGDTAGVLEATACRPYAAGIADRSSTPGDPDLPRRAALLHSPGRSFRGSDHTATPRRRHAVYGLAGRLSGAVVSLYWPGRYRRGRADRQSYAQRARRPDRLLREYAGLPHQ